jgi:pimeloyl-ACP methyl ester carboxylesterase
MTPMKKRMTMLAIAALFCSVGCPSPPKVPMDALRYDAGPSGRHGRNLIVFLQGRGGSHYDFEKQGFVEAVRKRNLPFDMVAPNAHFGYFRARNVDVRIKEDVLDPARNAGYENIWLVGVSMGGMASIFTGRRFPDSLDGIYLISPYITEPGILEEIDRSGGLKKWDPGEHDESDWQRLVWAWLKDYAGKSGEGGRAPLYLGYGISDQYAKTHKTLAAALPPKRVLRIEGGHTNEMFLALWEKFLDSGALSVNGQDFPNAKTPRAGPEEHLTAD